MRKRPALILVAHSLGCVLVSHLASRPSAAHVAGAFWLRQPMPNAWPYRIRNFAALHPCRATISAFPSIVVASRDDPYISFNKARALADIWGAGFVDMKNAGHINIESGFGSWPEAYILADSMRRPQERFRTQRAA